MQISQSKLEAIMANNADKLNLNPTKAIISIILLAMNFGRPVGNYLVSKSDTWQTRAENSYLIIGAIAVGFVLLGAIIELNRWWLKKTELEKSVLLKIVGGVLVMLCLALIFRLALNFPALLQSS
ncbi:hypothetical protein KBC40_00480 [Patescibacteria group bacterium]|nr:hypothetical protein [Patescibacteria group bacterium]